MTEFHTAWSKLYKDFMKWAGTGVSTKKILSELETHRFY
jgi:hypothetical protein